MSHAPRPPLRKSLGQHHLRSEASCHELVETLAVEGATVVEIGPGGGVLTTPLLASEAARVWAVELDLAWALELRRRVAEADPSPQVPLQIVVADAMEIGWHLFPDGFLLAGNLPYQVATPLLQGWLERAPQSPRAAVMVQWEVAQRLCARAGDEGFAALSLLIAARADVSMVRRVPKGAFVPAPKVDGGVVLLERRQNVPPTLLPDYVRVVKAAFGRRRKMLRGSLAAVYGADRALAALASASIPETARPEELGVEEFVRLAAGLTEPDSRRHPALVPE